MISCGTTFNFLNYLKNCLKDSHENHCKYQFSIHHIDRLRNICSQQVWIGRLREYWTLFQLNSCQVPATGNWFEISTGRNRKVFGARPANKQQMMRKCKQISESIGNLKVTCSKCRSPWHYWEIPPEIGGWIWCRVGDDVWSVLDWIDTKSSWFPTNRLLWRNLLSSTRRWDS